MITIDTIRIYFESEDARFSTFQVGESFPMPDGKSDVVKEITIEDSHAVVRWKKGNKTHFYGFRYSAFEKKI